MKRLFCVVDSKNKVMEYFDNKMKAKELRNKNEGSRISRGPDHMGKHGHTIARMRLQPKN